MFHVENNVFFKKAPFEDNIGFGIDFGANLPPYVGFQNLRFFDFWTFEEAFKISSFFASIFYRFWLRLGLQHGSILGAKTPQNRKNGSKKRSWCSPRAVLDTNLILKTVQEPGR